MMLLAGALKYNNICFFKKHAIFFLPEFSLRHLKLHKKYKIYKNLKSNLRKTFRVISLNCQKMTFGCSSQMTNVDKIRLLAGAVPALNLFLYRLGLENSFAWRVRILIASGL